MQYVTLASVYYLKLLALPAQRESISVAKLGQSRLADLLLSEELTSTHHVHLPLF